MQSQRIPERRRVLFALYYYRPYVSGLTLHIQRLADALRRRGWDVEVMTTRYSMELPVIEEINGIVVHRIRAFGRVSKGVIAPGFVPAIARIARRADVVVPVLPLAEAGAVACLVPKRKLLPFYVCDLTLGDSAIERAILRISERSARITVGRSTRFLGLSREFIQASPVVGDMADRAVGCQPLVDIDRWSRQDARHLDAHYGLHGRPVVGFVGRLVAEKGLPVLIEAMRLVRKEVADAALVIVGDSTNIAGGGLRHKLEETSTPGEVVFTGFLADEDLPAFYSRCDVLCLPSIDPLEAFGMVQVEAMLCGTPVVASDMPGVRIPIRETGMGLLAPPGDAPQLADAILTVLRNPDAYRRPAADVIAAFGGERSVDAFEATAAELR